MSAREFVERVEALAGDLDAAYAWAEEVEESGENYAIAFQPLRVANANEAAASVVPQLTAGWNAVLDVHKRRVADNGFDWCDECQDGPWPCKTVRALNAITNALGGEQA